MKKLHVHLFIIFFFWKILLKFYWISPPPPFSKYTPPTPPRRKPWTSPDEMQPWTLQKPWLECPSDPSDMAGLWVEKTSSVINLANNKKTFFFLNRFFCLLTPSFWKDFSLFVNINEHDVTLIFSQPTSVWLTPKRPK